MPKDEAAAQRLVRDHALSAQQHDSVRSQESLIFNACAGYVFDNDLRLQLDVLNLFNAQTNQIEYFYVSRCRANRSMALPTGSFIRSSRLRFA